MWCTQFYRRGRWLEFAKKASIPATEKSRITYCEIAKLPNEMWTQKATKPEGEWIRTEKRNETERFAFIKFIFFGTQNDSFSMQ